MAFSYDLRIRQGDLEIDLNSDDPTFIAKQIDQWCGRLLREDYLPMLMKRSIATVMATTPPVENLSKPLVEEKAPSEPQPASLPEASIPVDPVENLPPVSPPEPPPAPPAPAPPPPPDLEIPVAITEPAPTITSQLGEEIQDEFEAVMQQLLAEAPQTTSAPAPVAEPAVTVALPEPKTATVAPVIPEPKPSKTQESLFDPLEKFIQTGYDGDPVIALVFAGHYIKAVQTFDSFSLKQANAVFQGMGIPSLTPTHAEKALNQGWIDVVPDLGGIGETAAYAVTPAGEQRIAAFVQ